MPTKVSVLTSEKHRADVPVDAPTKALWPFAHAPGLHRWTGADR